MKQKSKVVLSRLFNVRVIAVVGVLGLMISYLSFSGETPKKFPDVKEENWAYDEIHFLADKGIISGYPDGNFKPSQSITRLQSIMMILREKGIEVNSGDDLENPGFIDVKPGDYGYEIVAKAVELGIIDGKVNNKGQRYFDPAGKLTRAQMAKILTNAYGLEGDANVKYSDVPTNHWAYDSIQALAKNGIAYGYGNGKYGANDSLTRAQFAGMMARILDDSFITSPPPSQPSQPSTDEWVAPVLKTPWSSDPAVNFRTLENELGFNNRGVYSLPSYPGVISVIGQGSSSSNEVGIKFMGWTDPALKYSERIPVVAKEVFKLYFAGDANRVWNYFNSNDIPEQFTANGRNVTASFSPADGSIMLYVAKK